MVLRQAQDERILWLLIIVFVLDKLFGHFHLGNIAYTRLRPYLALPKDYPFVGGHLL